LRRVGWVSLRRGVSGCLCLVLVLLLVLESHSSFLPAPRPRSALMKPARESSKLAPFVRRALPAVPLPKEPPPDGECDNAAKRRQREQNITALLSGSLSTRRQPLHTLLSADAVLRRPFQSPVEGAPAMSSVRFGLQILA
jgi:hypothetical protein